MPLATPGAPVWQARRQFSQALLRRAECEPLIAPTFANHFGDVSEHRREAVVGIAKLTFDVASRDTLSTVTVYEFYRN